MTESKFLKHIPCEACGSSDGNSLYDDSHEYCHVCHVYKHGDGTTTTQSKVPKPMNKDLKFYDTASNLSIVDRGLTKTSCLTYGIRQDEGKHYYPYYDADGVLVAVKTRKVANKEFSIAGDFKDATLFGQQLFNKGGKYLTICEGETDCVAMYQAMGSKYPVVSIRNGAQAALKDCKAQYEWIDSFESVVICFDADEPGNKAAKEVAELFGNKAKIAKLKKYKDPVEYLKNNLGAELVTAFWQAEAFVPDGIINAGVLADAIKKPLGIAPVLYPWEGLNKMLYGIRPAELVTLAAGSGLGKSTILRELVSHILNNTNEKVGLAFLEETPERTLRGLIGLEINKKIHLPDAVYDPAEIDAVYDRLDLNNRVYLWNHFGSNAIENVLARLKYFVKALGCQYLVLDHLSILISDQNAGDERKNIDMVMTKLRTFVQEMNCSLLLVSHLKRPEGKSLEDGAVTSLGMLRGSGAIAQLSDAVIGAERNSQADDVIERNTTRVRVLKSRYTGYTGYACSLYYDDPTGRLREINDTL